MGCGVAGVLACGLVPDAAVAVPDLHLFPGCHGGPGQGVSTGRATCQWLSNVSNSPCAPFPLLITMQFQLTRRALAAKPENPSHKSTGNSLAGDLHDNNRSSNHDNNRSQSIPFAADLRMRPAGAASFTRRSGRLARRPYGLWPWELPFIQHQTLRWLRYSRQVFLRESGSTSAAWSHLISAASFALVVFKRAGLALAASGAG